MNNSQKGWHSRGYLPHLDAVDELQSITFRLGDAVPEQLIDRWKDELGGDQAMERKLRVRIERYADAGHGSCLLTKPGCARVVQGVLRFFAGERYHLLEWCVMPNHVHVLLAAVQGWQLGELVKGWKRTAAKEINRTEGRRGSLWQADYFDRYVRDEDHLLNVRLYIRNNPVKAGLCAEPEDWEWSSAWRGRAWRGRGGD